jgi:hypothetical protein
MHFIAVQDRGRRHLLVGGGSGESLRAGKVELVRRRVVREHVHGRSGAAHHKRIARGVQRAGSSYVFRQSRENTCIEKRWVTKGMRE